MKRRIGERGRFGTTRVHEEIGGFSGGVPASEEKRVGGTRVAGSRRDDR